MQTYLQIYGIEQMAICVNFAFASQPSRKDNFAKLCDTRWSFYLVVDF